MKKLMKKSLSIVLAFCMLLSVTAGVDFSAFAEDSEIEKGVPNRAEWLGMLVEAFDMTVEEDNYPDNYYSDIDDSSPFYRNIMVATEFGFVDVEAGDPVDPEGELTREFVAHSLNSGLGFILDGADDPAFTYSFADSDICSYPVDDQIAINREWFAVDEDNNFNPEQAVTLEEIDPIIDDTLTNISLCVVDDNYDSTYEYADGVVEVPNGTEVTVDENDVVTIVDCPVEINKDEDFIVYILDLPVSYTAVNVSKKGNTTIIETKECSNENIIQNADMQTVSEIDCSQFQLADGLEVVAESKQYGTAIPEMNNDLKFKGNVKIDDITISLSAKISNCRLETKSDENGILEVVKSDIDITYSTSVKIGKSLDVPIVYHSIMGIGYVKLSFVAKCSGEVSISEKIAIENGIYCSKDGSTRSVLNFKHKDFSLSVSIKGSAGVKLEFGIHIAIVKGDIYGGFGVSGSAEAKGYVSGKPSSCVSFKGYVYCNTGAELEINCFFIKKTFSAEKEWWSSSSSPYKFSFHFEDGEKVPKCTRGDEKYITPEKSKVALSDDLDVNDYTGYSSEFTYSVNADGTATITKYTGTATNVKIPTYINNYKVTSIGDSVFYRCYSLTSVTIPNSVTSIGNGAFWECKSLTSVTIPDSVTSIGSYAFCYCTSLTSVNVDVNNKNYSSQDGVLFNKDKTELIQYPIGNIRKEYSIPNSVTNIGEYAFRSCTSLTSVIIPNSVTSIGDYAFCNCTSLTSVTIPNSVTSIGECAFYDCTSLTSVTIGDSVTSIGYRAFCNCTSLTRVIIGNSVTSIVRDVFWNCTSLTSVTIPNSVTSIGQRAFCNCASLTSVTIGNSVTSIGEYAFDNCTSLTSVTIGNSVTSIVRYAFYNCTSLTSVTIPNSVTSIGEQAFYHVNNIIYNGSATGSPWGAKAVNGYVDGYLVYKDSTKNKLLGCSSQATSVTIPNSVTSIGSYAFEDCASLTSVTIPNSVTSIGDYAFEGCTSLTSVTIGNSVTSIGKYAFYNCARITSIIIPNSVTSIGDYAFYNCSSLTSVTIGNSVTSIGQHAFCNCVSLTSVTIPNSVTSIGSLAFYFCRSLTSVTIPDSVTSIGSDAFYNVLNVIYNGTATGSPWGAKFVNGYVDGYLIYKDSSKNELLGCSFNATSVTIPNSVTSIEEGAFSGCRSLTSVTIPNSVTSIGDYAFSYCTSLTSVTIPNSVTSIGWKAFGDCISLTDVYYTGTQEQWLKISIDDYNDRLKNANIHYNYSTCDSHIYEMTIDREATCTQKALYRYTCANCGDNYTEIVGDYLEHKFSLKSSTLPTCTDEGIDEYSCECGITVSHYADALGHNYIFDDYSYGVFSYHCADCNKKNNGVKNNLPSFDEEFAQKVVRGKDSMYLDFNNDGYVNAKDYVILHRSFGM